MSYEQILTDIKNKSFKPLYLLHGEESYFIDEISNALETSVLNETEREFDQMVFYGRDASPNEIINAIRRAPMIGRYMVVVVREAQDMKKIEELELYFNKPSPYGILVIAHKHKKADSRRSWVKTIQKAGVVFESKRLYDNQVPDWIRNYIKNKGYSITPQACMLLAESIGSDLQRVTNEIGKLLINLSQGAQIDENLIEQNIGISKDFNVFELNKAIGTKNHVKANQIVNYFAANPGDNPIVLTIGAINQHFTRILLTHSNLAEKKGPQALTSELGIPFTFTKEYYDAAGLYPLNKVKEIFALLREYDLKSKGLGNESITHGDLVRELVFKIMHNLPQN